MNNLGSTLVIVNPEAHSGKGAAAVDVIRRFFETCSSASTDFDLQVTNSPRDAERIAAAARQRDSVIAVGGDGVIHEVVNGLMAIDEENRPRLGIIPFGSGNDYARTLNITANDAERAIAQMMASNERVVDLGYVVSDACVTGMYFTESLSFGLDAAIAIDTTRHRAAGTKQEGSSLFLSSSIRLAARARKGYRCKAVIDNDEPLQLTSLIFAVLNGPTYGGGFRICPSADPCDGFLDVCYNTRRPWTAHLMLLLGLARFGRHTRSRLVRMRKLRTVKIEFFEDVPCQVDGEELAGTDFAIKVVPQALRVLSP